jgi:hypothetical protein
VRPDLERCILPQPLDRRRHQLVVGERDEGAGRTCANSGRMRARHRAVQPSLRKANARYAYTEARLRPSPDYFARLWSAVLRLVSPAGQ